MPGRSPSACGSLLWAEPGLAARPLPGQLAHEGVTQAFELRSQVHRVLRALGRELVRSNRHFRHSSNRAVAPRCAALLRKA